MVSVGRSAKKWLLPPVQSRWRFVGALAAGVVFVFVQLALPIPPDFVPFMFSFVGVAVAAWLGGVVPGLLAVLLTALLANYFFVAGTITEGRALFATGWYLLTASSVAGLCGSMRKNAVLSQQRQTLSESVLEQRALALAAAHAASFEWDLRDDTIEWSNELLSLYGQARRDGEDCRDNILEEDRIANAAALKRAIQTGELDITFRVRRGDSGEVRWVQSRGRVFYDGNHQAVRLVGINIDVTERLEAEEQMRASEARFRGVFEGAPVGMARVRLADAAFIDVNDALSHMLGYARDELLDQPWHDVAHARDDTLEPAPFSRLANGEIDRHTLERRFIHKDGRVVWARLTFSLVRDARGHPDYEIAIVEDITDRVRAEQALRDALESAEERGQLLEAMMEHIPLGITIADAPDVRVRQVSRYGRELIEGRPDAEPGGTPWIVYHADGVTQASVDEMPLTRAVRGELVQGEEWVIEARDGKRIPILCTGAPIRNGSGKISGGVIGWQDITERRAAVAALRDSEAALREANERLLEADRRKNEFLAVLSHELRNPLAPIRNSVCILEKAPAGGAQAKRAMQVIDRQAEQMARLIDDLLDVTRISRGKITLKRERLELNALVQATAEDYRDGFEASGITLEVATAAAPLWIEGDRVRIAQVVGNLLSNALKFTPRGGRTTLAVAPGDHADAVVSVRDSGTGMSSETLAHLFEPFSQAAQTIERTRGGLGLGLALVKALVEMHGGSVSAFSKGEGKGSEVVVVLPKEEGTAPAAGAAPTQTAARPRRVLIIEDNVDAAESLKEVLELDEHEVHVALTGPEGLDAARRVHPDVIICDIGLPGMDGYGVARALRHDDDETLRSTYLIALSGYALSEDIARSRAAGFNQHMAKPPSIEGLEKLIAEAHAP